MPKASKANKANAQRRVGQTLRDIPPECIPWNGERPFGRMTPSLSPSVTSQPQLEEGPREDGNLVFVFEDGLNPPHEDLGERASQKRPKHRKTRKAARRKRANGGAESAQSKLEASSAQDTDQPSMYMAVPDRHPSSQPSFDNAPTIGAPLDRGLDLHHNHGFQFRTSSPLPESLDAREDGFPSVMPSQGQSSSRSLFGTGVSSQAFNDSRTDALGPGSHRVSVSSTSVRRPYYHGTRSETVATSGSSPSPASVQMSQPFGNEAFGTFTPYTRPEWTSPSSAYSSFPSTSSTPSRSHPAESLGAVVHQGHHHLPSPVYTQDSARYGSNSSGMHSTTMAQADALYGRQSWPSPASPWSLLQLPASPMGQSYLSQQPQSSGSYTPRGWAAASLVRPSPLQTSTSQTPHYHDGLTERWGSHVASGQMRMYDEWVPSYGDQQLSAQGQNFDMGQSASSTAAGGAYAYATPELYQRSTAYGDYGTPSSQAPYRSATTSAWGAEGMRLTPATSHAYSDDQAYDGAGPSAQTSFTTNALGFYELEPDESQMSDADQF